MTDVNEIRGCEDFEEVFAFDDGVWEWDVFDMFYSPSARRYFWYNAAGCSCDGPYEDVGSAGDLQNGSYQDAVREVRENFSANDSKENKALEALRKNNREVNRQG